MAKKIARLKGSLGRPIRVKKPLAESIIDPHSGARLLLERLKAASAEKERRLMLICDEYGIEQCPYSWMRLAQLGRILAEITEPGLQITMDDPSSGRPKNDAFDDMRFVYEVETIAHERQKGRLDACRQWAKRHRIDASARQIDQRVRDAKNRIQFSGFVLAADGDERGAVTILGRYLGME